MYGDFKQQANEIVPKKTWILLRKEKPHTESLTIAAQNNAMRTNYIRAKIDDTQQND